MNRSSRCRDYGLRALDVRRENRPLSSNSSHVIMFFELPRKGPEDVLLFFVVIFVLGAGFALGFVGSALLAFALVMFYVHRKERLRRERTLS